MKNYSNEIADLQLQITEVTKERRVFEDCTDLKVKQVLDSYFNPFQEVEIIARGCVATFYLKDQDGLSREILSLCFEERYKQANQLRVYYYSTFTHSDFELQRLVHLGKVASIIINKSEVILNEVHQVIKLDQGRLSELFSIESQYQKQIAEYEKAAKDQHKVEVKLALINEGVSFDGRCYVKLKNNYSPLISFIKISEVSKSGKTCTVLFNTSDLISTKEENCSLQSVVDQVTALYENIVQELLPA
jgi:hypothetical protein